MQHQYFSMHSPLPNSKTLVIWRADKPTILINKCDGVNGSQVTVVLLNHLACPDVPLWEMERGTKGVKTQCPWWHRTKQSRLLKMSSQNGFLSIVDNLCCGRLFMKADFFCADAVKWQQEIAIKQTSLYFLENSVHTFKLKERKQHRTDPQATTEYSAFLSKQI